MTIGLLSFFILLISSFQAATPYLLRKNIVFGVTIPSGYEEEFQASSFKKRYSLAIAVIGLFVFSIFLFVAIKINEPDTQVFAFIVSLSIILIAGSLLYVMFHIQLSKRKQRLNLGKGLKQIRIADLSARTNEEMLPTLLYLLPIFMTVGLFIFSVIHYDQLPNRVPIHWGPNGQPDVFREKTWFTAHVNVYILFIMQCMLLGINYFVKRSGIRLSATHTATSRIRQLAFRKYSSWLLFFVSITSTILISFLHLTSFSPSFNHSVLMIAAPIGFLVAILLATGLYAVKIGQGGSRIRLVEEEAKEGVTDVDDDRFWKLGIFYVNLNDPSVFVEKRFGVGWSINYGNWISYCVILLPVILIVTIAILI